MSIETFLYIRREDLQALLDVATGSMNYSSGFLDNAEVDVLRRVAVELGLDPIEFTPSNFVGSYAHDFKAHERRSDICHWCRRGLDDQVHRGVSVNVEREREW